MQKPDSLIFDMDGTLWDAVDTYTNSWNIIFERLGLDKRITRNELAAMVGWEGKKVLNVILGEFEEDRQNEIYAMVNAERRVLLPAVGGILYDGVKEGLAQLATKYQLFIVSNCAVGVIRLFIDWAGINEYITDEIAYGINKMPKNHNIKLLVDQYQLQNPVYIGDTEGDAEQSRLAGVPFVLLTHGFGTTENYDLKFDDFNAFTNYFMAL